MVTCLVLPLPQHPIRLPSANLLLRNRHVPSHVRLVSLSSFFSLPRPSLQSPIISIQLILVIVSSDFTSEALGDPRCPLGSKMEDVSDHLLVEGYLTKIRGFGRNRKRWFRLTENYVAFYTADAGSLISYIDTSRVESVRDVSKYRFELVSSVPFGASGASSMLLEARTEDVQFLLACLFVSRFPSRPKSDGS